jgi:hypothetical protein
VLFVAAEGVPVATLRDNRGWSEEEWDAAATRLRARGLLDRNGAITVEGRDARYGFEATTDRLARVAPGQLGARTRSFGV